jgi:hypothetical protein
MDNILMCRLIARQRLGKHSPAHDNRTSIVRQQCGKHVSSTLQAVFSVSSVPRVYKWIQKTRPSSNSLFGNEERSFGTPVCQDVLVCLGAEELSRVESSRVESSLWNWQLQNNGKKGIRLLKMTQCVISIDSQTVENPLPGYNY